MTDPATWPTVAEQRPPLGARCNYFVAGNGWSSSGAGVWVERTSGLVFVRGFYEPRGLMCSDPAQTHWQLADGPAVPESREPASVAGEATPAPFRNFDGMCWPVPCERLGTLEHCLRYDHEITHFSMKDRLLAASVIAAYLDLIQRPNIRRNAICKELQKGTGSADG